MTNHNGLVMRESVIIEKAQAKRDVKCECCLQQKAIRLNRYH